MALILLDDRSCEGCTVQQQKIFGCDAHEDPPGSGLWKGAAIAPVSLFGETQWQCPRRPIKDNPGYWRDLFNYWRAFKTGLLPDEGAIGAQSYRGWTLLTLLDAYVSEAEGERIRQISKGK
jgi:hypothetical protein